MCKARASVSIKHNPDFRGDGVQVYELGVGGYGPSAEGTVGEGSMGAG